MYIHSAFLKEVIDNPDLQVKKERVSALAFFYLFKSRYSNSIFYDYHTNQKTVAIKRYSLELSMDHRTVNKYVNLLIKWGLAVRHGDHLQMVSMDKAFEYKTKKNGRQDRNYQKKFIKVRVGKKWCLRQMRSYVRVLLFKVVSNNKLLAKFYKGGEPFCKETSVALFRITRRLVPRRKAPGMNLMCKFGIKLISKTMGVSKSTADRVIQDMVKSRVIFRDQGAYKKIGNVSDLTIPMDKVRSHTYGALFSKNKLHVLKKECNSYAI